MEILELLIPVFAIFVAGILFAHFKILPEGTGDTLIQFAFWVAIPALLFLIISQESVDRLFNAGFYISYAGGSAVMFLLVLFGALYWRKMPLGEATVLTLTAVLCNTAFVALPILHTAFGHKAVLPAAIATVIMTVFLIAAVLLLEKSIVAGSQQKVSVLVSIRHAVLNPIILSTVLGVAYVLTGWSLPSVAINFLEPLSHAATPCALFAIGMSIKLEDFRVGMSTIAFVTLVKLIVLPGVIFLLTLVVGLDPLYAIAATVCAAVPTAKNAFILASQYNISKDRAAATISVTTAGSIVTLLIWLFILSHVYSQPLSM